MSQILILKGDRADDDSGAYKTWWALKGQASGDEYFLENYRDIAFAIRDGRVSCFSLKTARDLASYDLVYIRDIVYEHERNAIALYLQGKGRRFINREAALFQHRSKLTQYIAMAQAGIPVPDTFYAQSQELPQLAERYQLGFPLIMKSITGSNGADNVLVSSREDLPRTTISQAILQPYIPNAYDYRVVVAGQEVLVAYKRIRAAGSVDHKNNVAKGAVRELVYELPTEVRDLALAAAKALRRDISGIDILPNSETGEYFVLESNASFGMAPSDEEIGAHYFKQLAKYLHRQATA